MKLQASAQNPFSLPDSLPFVSPWAGRTARRSTFEITPFAFEEAAGLVARTDALARKQEIVCAVILALCFCFTMAVCLVQLARL